MLGLQEGGAAAKGEVAPSMKSPAEVEAYRLENLQKQVDAEPKVELSPNEAEAKAWLEAQFDNIAVSEAAGLKPEDLDGMMIAQAGQKMKELKGQGLDDIAIQGEMSNWLMEYATASEEKMAEAA